MTKEIKIKSDSIELIFKYPIRVGFLPDLHSGATRAITLEEFETKEGTRIVPNDIQKLLRKLWLRNIEMFKKYQVQYIFVIGDSIAGLNPAEAGYFISMTPPDQVKLAADLLEEVWVGCDKKPIFFIWSGTGYHEGRKGMSDLSKQLVDALNAKGIKATDMSDCAYIDLFCGKDILTNQSRIRRIFVSHEAATGLVYPATLLSRDITWALESEASNASLPVDAIVRAHLHHWLHVDHSGKHAVQLPCWLGHTPYNKTIKYFFKLQPTLGGAMMVMDEYGRLDFWGGSYPFGFAKDEYLRIHELCVTRIGLDPETQKKYLEREELEKRKNPIITKEDIKKTREIFKNRKY